MADVGDSKKQPVEYLSAPGDPTTNAYLSYYTEYAVAQHQQPQAHEPYHHREARQMLVDSRDIGDMIDDMIDDRSDDDSATQETLNDFGSGIRRRYQKIRDKIRNLTDDEKTAIRDLIFNRREKLGSQRLFDRFLDATVRQAV